MGWRVPNPAEIRGVGWERERVAGDNWANLSVRNGREAGDRTIGNYKFTTNNNTVCNIIPNFGWHFTG